MSYKASDKRYEKITYNTCGKSGLKMPPISLGLWHNFGDVDDFENARKMIWTAFDNGITHFDLANNYGPAPGSAEASFGKILKSDLAKYRDELIISTKAGHLMWPGPYGDGGSRKYLLASLDQSLKRMGLDYVDIFYTHRPDPDTPIEETYDALAQAVRQGKALYIGISKYTSDQTRQVNTYLKSIGHRILIHQFPYSLLRLRRELIDDGILDTLTDLAAGCIVFCPLAQGLLTDKYLKGIPEGSRAAKSHGFLQTSQITEEKIKKVRALNEIASARGQKMAQLALTWVLRDERVTSVIIGASKVSQIEDAVAVVNQPNLTAQELDQIETVLLS